MSLRIDLQNQLSQAAKSIIDALADTVSYQNRAGTLFTGLTAHPDAERHELREYLGTSSTLTMRTFTLPYQTNFPVATGVDVGDLIVFNSISYRVETVSDVSGGYQALWELDCIRVHPETVGVRVIRNV